MSQQRQDRVAGGRRGVVFVRCTEAEHAELRKLAAKRGGMSLPKLLVQSTLATEAGSDLFRREAATALLSVADQLDELAGMVDGEVRERLVALTADGSPLAGVIGRLAMPDGRSRRR